MDTTLRKGSEAEVRSVGPWPELGETRAAAACPACPRPPAGGARGPPGATGGAGARPGAGPVPGRAGRWGNVLVGCRWVLTAQAPLKLGLSLPLLFRPRRTTRCWGFLLSQMVPSGRGTWAERARQQVKEAGA
ncbi:uncharacterized protein AAG666_019481 isoform 2-T2 [Megaptera novaeangliae]